MFGWLPESFTIKCNVSWRWGPVSPEKQEFGVPAKVTMGNVASQKVRERGGCLDGVSVTETVPFIGEVGDGSP